MSYFAQQLHVYKATYRWRRTAGQPTSQPPRWRTRVPAGHRFIFLGFSRYGREDTSRRARMFIANIFALMPFRHCRLMRSSHLPAALPIATHMPHDALVYRARPRAGHEHFLHYAAAHMNTSNTKYLRSSHFATFIRQCAHAVECYHSWRIGFLDAYFQLAHGGELLCAARIFTVYKA
jgi:hypothetical protein